MSLTLTLDTPLSQFLKDIFIFSYAQAYKVVAIIVVFTIIALSPPASAKDFPYFASIKSDEANIRTGPNVRYPIQWTYKRHNWPVEVTAKFERWRKIRDIYGEIGWIHENLISKRRFAVIKANGFQEVYRLPMPTAAKVFIAENGVIAEIEECKDSWCKIKAEKQEGWLETKNLWGVGEKEVVE